MLLYVYIHTHIYAHIHIHMYMHNAIVQGNKLCNFLYNFHSDYIHNDYMTM